MHRINEMKAHLINDSEWPTIEMFID